MSTTDMKKLIIMIFYGIFGCLSVLSQETAIFHIQKINSIGNGCYELTAKANGEKYTIYTHYDDEEKDNREKIRRHEYIELTIIPFFETEHISHGDGEFDTFFLFVQWEKRIRFAKKINRYGKKGENS